MPNDQAEYQLAPKAREDIEVVWLYSLNRWGAKKTDLYIDDLTEAFTFLARTPKAGIVCDHIRPGYRRYPVNRHVVYYRKTPYGIEIMRILHDRMLAARHF